MTRITTTTLALLASVALAPLALAQQGPIKIGVNTPLSGTYAPIGQQVRWGLELAAKDVNAAGGIAGRQVQLIFEDEEANPAVAVQKADKLFQVDKVDFMTGTVNSGSTLAVGQIAERAGKLVATTVSFADSITGDRCSPNVFRVNARAEQQSSALAAWLTKEKPNPKVYFLGPDYEMGRSTVAAFQAGIKARGGSVLGEVFAPLDSKDYSQYFGQIRAARPQVLYTSVAGNDTVRLLTQMQEFGLLSNLQVVGASGTLTSQNIGAIGSAADNFATGVGYSPQIDTPENKAFVSKFQAAYKADPDLYGADSYGLVFFYKAAVEKAGSTETDKVREAMRGLEWDTPQGRKTMRAGDHQALQTMYVVRVEKQKFNIVGQVPATEAVGPDLCTKF
ncbi:ABC transporter substrate-binding protein [Enterovirga sp.]|jgi:branched-chain amino acid transport system substrate-binding protein|uniref:ABC transporter substrate-binding protein n=1 Tax=Enterovirga sp. TaxID=2026350 RepID=UPI00261ACDEF|nr:ABC transporter substrate-binding protein [Enterovirga sp.]MDB5590146.1 receptor ligand binding region family protein [Enterovirga sp.]